MIGSLITSRTRIKLLKKFFLNCNTRAHLRGLESEFGESTNAIRVELNRLEDAGLLDSVRSGNKKFYQANTTHPLFKDIRSIVIKDTGLDKVIEKVIERLGRLICVYLTGDFARGIDSPIIELILVGIDIDQEYLERKISQAEELVPRKVKCIVIGPNEAEKLIRDIAPSDLLLIWSKGSKELIDLNKSTNW